MKIVKLFIWKKKHKTLTLDWPFSCDKLYFGRVIWKEKKKCLEEL